MVGLQFQVNFEVITLMKCVVNNLWGAFSSLDERRGDKVNV